MDHKWGFQNPPHQLNMRNGQSCEGMDGGQSYRCNRTHKECQPNNKLVTCWDIKLTRISSCLLGKCSSLSHFSGFIQWRYCRINLSQASFENLCRAALFGQKTNWGYFFKDNVFSEWFRFKENNHFCITIFILTKKMLWLLAQLISAAIQCFIVMLFFPHLSHLSVAASCSLDTALYYTAQILFD